MQSEQIIAAWMDPIRDHVRFSVSPYQSAWARPELIRKKKRKKNETKAK